MVPSYDKQVNVNAINTGRIGIMIFDTIASTIFWNSSKIVMIVFDFVQIAASPIKIENASALMTFIICGIVSPKTSSGNSFKPSISDTTGRFGIIAYPAPIERSAASTDDVYATTSATPSIRDALFPSFVIDGAINPMTINGTTKLMTCPRIFFNGTTTLITFSGKICPKIIPITMPINNFTGRLLNIFFIPYLTHSSYLINFFYV